MSDKSPFRETSAPEDSPSGAVPAHVCFYSDRLIWDDWTPAGPLAERVARRVPVCTVCGRQRPALRPRPAVRREGRAEVAEAPPPVDLAGRIVASVVQRRTGGADNGEAAAPGLFSALASRGVPAGVAEEWLDRFLRAGWIEERWLAGRGANRLEAVILRNAAALQEIAHPGAGLRRRQALETARAEVVRLTHPKAREIAALLTQDAALHPEIARALAAVAMHVESGEVLTEREVSARRLGDPRALAAIRGRLEHLIGSLADVGIRDSVAVTLLGGTASLRFPALTLSLSDLPPFFGISHESLERCEEILFPGDGLLVVEGLPVFEACCRGRFAGVAGTAGTGKPLVVWSTQVPGPAVRGIVERAGAAGVPVRVWADIDLDGVRMARLVVSWAPAVASPWRMTPGDLAAAPSARLLSPRALGAIRRELGERPDALLADTLAALLQGRRRVEQEAFLG